MNEKPSIFTERIDDIPLLLAQMERMGLAGLLDTHFPIHGNWQGLPLGQVATIWLSSILSRGDHRLVHVEPWVAGRALMLSQISGEAIRADDFSDDRLEIVLRLLSDDSRWAAFEGLNIEKILVGACEHRRASLQTSRFFPCIRSEYRDENHRINCEYPRILCK